MSGGEARRQQVWGAKGRVLGGVGTLPGDSSHWAPGRGRTPYGREYGSPVRQFRVDTRKGSAAALRFAPVALELTRVTACTGPADSACRSTADGAASNAFEH